MQSTNLNTLLATLLGTAASAEVSVVLAKKKLTLKSTDLELKTQTSEVTYRLLGQADEVKLTDGSYNFKLIGGVLTTMEKFKVKATTAATETKTRTGGRSSMPPARQFD